MIDDARTSMRALTSPWTAVALAGVYVVALSGFSVAQHHGFRTQMNDLGNADQALWAFAQGDFAMTQSNTYDGVPRPRVAEHANFVFYVLGPLYWIWPRPELLLVLNGLACAAAGLGVYFFARRRLGASPWALVPALAFWIHPAVHDANLYDFHVVTLVAAAITWAAWAFDAGRARAGFALAAAAMLCAEDAPLLTFMLGAGVALGGARRRGLWLMVASAAYFALAVGALLPLFRGGAHATEGAARYAWLGGGGVMDVLRVVFTVDHLRLPAYWLLCGAAAAWRGWRTLLLLLPLAAQGLLSDLPWMTRITGTYYWVAAPAIIAMACAVSAERARWPLLWLSGATLVFSFWLSPLPHGWHGAWAHFAPAPAEARAALARAAARVPPEARLCVQNNLGPHLAHRVNVSARRSACEKADYRLFYLRPPPGPLTRLFVRTELSGLFNRPLAEFRGWVDATAQSWAPAGAEEGVYLFSRGAAQESARVRPELARLTEADAAMRASEPGWVRYLSGRVDSAVRR